MKKAHEAKDINAIDSSMAALNTAWQAASQEMYNATQGQGPQGGTETGPEGNGKESAENVTDVDYEEVDGKK